MNIEVLKKKFEDRLKEMPEKELEEFDDWFWNVADDLTEFYGINRCLRNEEQRDKMKDFLYMYAIAYNKDDFDERYDQAIFSAAAEYAGIDLKHCEH